MLRVVDRQGNYVAYLLRLWRIDGDGGGVWRASLECPATGTRQGFADLQTLFTFLSETCGDNSSDIHPHLDGQPVRKCKGANAPQEEL